MHIQNFSGPSRSWDAYSITNPNHTNLGSSYNGAIEGVSSTGCNTFRQWDKSILLRLDILPMNCTFIVTAETIILIICYLIQDHRCIHKLVSSIKKYNFIPKESGRETG